MKATARVAHVLILSMAFATLANLAHAEPGSVVQASYTRAQQARQAIEDARPILPRLVGLRLVDTPAKLKGPQALTADISVDGPSLLNSQAFYRELEGYLGKPFSHATMVRITATVTAWYRAHHRPFVDVTFPQQDISRGIVQAVVTEFRVGHVRARGNGWYSSDLLTSSVRLERGDLIDTSVLDSDLAQLNQSPYLQVTAVAEKSDIPDATDIVLNTHDRLPFHIFTGYNNGGLPVLGRGTWSAGFDWGNAFWQGQDLSYVFTSTDDFWLRPGDVGVSPGHATLAEHQASYSIPLPWDDRLVFFGNYAEAIPRIGPFFSQIGVSWQASTRYVWSLPQTAHMQENIEFGYDFKRTNNNLAFGGFAISRSSTEIDQFPFIYNATIDDPMGRTIVLDQVVFSPGGLTGRNNDAAFQPSATQVGVPFAHASYVYADANLTRLTRLPFDTGWLLRFQGQYSTSNLLASEELGDGGIETVRGYDERATSGPLGVLLSNEIRSPAFGVIDPLFKTNIQDKLQADVFWDFGYVQQEKFLPGGQNTALLQSVGGGAHYAIGRFVDLRFDYGLQLRRAPEEVHRGGEAYFSAVIGY